MPWVRDERLDSLGFLQFPHKEQAINFVGIDLYKKSISVGVVGQERKVWNRKRFAFADPDRIVGFFKPLRLRYTSTLSPRAPFVGPARCAYPLANGAGTCLSR